MREGNNSFNELRKGCKPVMYKVGGFLLRRSDILGDGIFGQNKDRRNEFGTQHSSNKK